MFLVCRLSTRLLHHVNVLVHNTSPLITSCFTLRFSLTAQQTAMFISIKLTLGIQCGQRLLVWQKDVSHFQRLEKKYTKMWPCLCLPGAEQFYVLLKNWTHAFLMATSGRGSAGLQRMCTHFSMWACYCQCRNIEIQGFLQVSSLPWCSLCCAAKLLNVHHILDQQPWEDGQRTLTGVQGRAHRKIPIMLSAQGKTVASCRSKRISVKQYSLSI